MHRQQRIPMKVQSCNAWRSNQEILQCLRHQIRRNPSSSLAQQSLFCISQTESTDTKRMRRVQQIKKLVRSFVSVWQIFWKMMIEREKEKERERERRSEIFKIIGAFILFYFFFNSEHDESVVRAHCQNESVRPNQVPANILYKQKNK